MALNQTAQFAVGAQAAKGSAAANYVAGRMQESNAVPNYETANLENEHSGIHERATILQSSPIRVGYLGNFRGVTILRAKMIPHLLLMSGFISTIQETSFVLTITDGDTGDTYTLTYDDTGANPQETAALDYNEAAADIAIALNALSNAPAGGFTVTGDAGGPYTITASGVVVYADGEGSPDLAIDDTLMDSEATSSADLSAPYAKHRFTIDDGDTAGSYGSILHAVGEGASRFTRNLVDCKVSEFELAATRTGIMNTFSGMNISESDALGTEVVTVEDEEIIHQATGAFLLTSTDITAAGVGTPRGNTFTVSNSLSEEDQKLHSFFRASLPQDAFNVSGMLQGIDFGEDLYKELNWGSLEGTSPSIYLPKAQLTWSWETYATILTGIPYSMEIDVKDASVMLQPFTITGTGEVLWDLAYRMLDRYATDPLVIDFITDDLTFTS